MSTPSEPAAGAPILFYDGVCGLCDRSVRFVLARDRRRRFRFTTLQSPFARDVLPRYGVEPGALDTVYLLLDRGGPDERLLARSDAALAVLRELGGIWSRAAALAGLLPRRLRDALYRLVVHNRYRVFGRYDACPLPPPQLRDRFVDQSLPADGVTPAETA